MYHKWFSSRVWWVRLGLITLVILLSVRPIFSLHNGSVTSGHLFGLAKSLDQKFTGYQETVWREAINPVRYQLTLGLRSNLRHLSSQTLLPALLVGDRQYLTYENWQVLAKTGTSHLIAISGLHVGMVWWLANVVLSTVLVRVIRPERARFWSLLLAWMVAAFYSLLAGFSVPTQRALFMLWVMVFCLLARRIVPPFDGWLIAMVGVVLLDASAPSSVSFWLSFLAVAILIGLAWGRLSQERPYRVWIRVQCALALGLLPCIGSTFGAVSWIAPFVNLLAVPIVTMAVLPLLLLSIPIMLIDGAITTFWFWGVSLIVDWCWQMLVYFASWSWIMIPLPRDVIGIYAVSLLASIALFLPRPLPGRGVWLLLFLPLIFTAIGLD